MKQLCFLYKGDEPGSLALRDTLAERAIAHGVRFWSDVRATDPGFATDLRIELSRSDAIIQCVGPRGIGFYQNINEVDATLDALRARPGLRLVTVLLNGVPRPPAFSRFDDLVRAPVTLAQDSARLDPLTVLQAALPGVTERLDGPESRRAAKLIDWTLRATKPKSLTIIVGPYASAEMNEPSCTPGAAISSLLSKLGLPGSVPWLDVLGSVARATVDSPVEAALLMQDALGTAGPPNKLEFYLGLLAANWARKSSASRLIIIACTPDLRLDVALRKSGRPIPHVRLVHCPKRDDRLFAQRIEVHNLDTVVEVPIDVPAGPLQPAPLQPDDRVVLIKPFGCFEDKDNLLITAEHWRDATAGQQMKLPSRLAQEIAQSAIITLGAGAFSPSLQVVFRTLLKDALQNADRHAYRYLVHDGQFPVEDELHKVECALANLGHKYVEQYKSWLWENYELKLDRLEPLTLLANVDHQLTQFA